MTHTKRPPVFPGRFRTFSNPMVGRFTGRYSSPQALAGEAQEEKRLRDLAKAKGEPFQSLPGGTYLSAIYAGDFKAQDIIAYDYLDKIRKNNSGDIGMGVFWAMLGSKLATAKVDMTVLEEISLYYLKRASERDDDCFDKGAVERTFKYSYPAMVYEDGYRTPASSITSRYKINPDFLPLCDRLCEGQGVLYMVAQGMNMGSEKLEVADLYSGIDDIIKHYSCRSPEVRQFEANLIKLNEMEYRQEPTVRRNTFRALL